MKFKLFVGTMVMALSACSTAESETLLVGADRDKHNCISSAGYSWSELKQQCIQTFDIADIKLADPDNQTLAIYVILSEDKSQAEVFKSDLHPSQKIFDVVKGGYISKDNSMRLMNTKQGWKFLKEIKKIS
ncbi:hypothetical protein [Mannheimia massilioguelmaensis]|uniref:hypothetical protein n=1 Tax=Mannheimia massilioguelmaensis TaxID=1604354 RepID=UPI000AFE7490|nr:hypothetical protein [Mannheimia massilioguelmaensis]